MDSALLETTPAAPVWYRRGFAVLCGVAALVLLAHIALALWARNEIAAAESIVALHSMMLANDGTLYYSNQAYPYTITAYMPVYYTLEAALYKAGIPIFLAGRLISMGALAGILLVCWRTVLLYTRDKWCAGLAVALCCYTTVVPGWGTIGRVDMLSVFFSLAAFYQYSRYAEEKASRAILGSGLFAFAALMTKQTLIAAPTVICILLWFRNRKLAVQYAASVLGALVAFIAVTDLLLHGRFLFNTVFANVNPFTLEKLQQHASFYFISLGQLIAVILAGLSKVLRSRLREPFVYLGLSALVLLGTAGKIGSDTNYHLESAILIVICAAISLHLLSFHAHVFRGSKAWITLLQLPLLIHAVNNVRIMIPFFQTRIVQEYEMDDFAKRLNKFYGLPSGPVVAMDFNSLIRSRGKLDVEPLIYTILVNAGRIDPEPLRRDIEAGRVPFIMLHEDLFKPASMDPEIPSLPSAQLAAMREHYRFVEHVPGPYFGGVYVYQPNKAALAAARHHR